MKYKKLIKRLKNAEIILMDGAMGTEILNRGVPTTLPLWSAEALLTHPEVVQQIYEDYIKAGAEIIITNTFATTKRTFAKKEIGEKASEATILACKLAQQARNAVKVSHDVYIAGSVAPLEDCYSPELTPSQKELEKEHYEIVRDLKDGGVDFILIETMITLRETLAALAAAKVFDLPVAVSFCCNDKYQLLGGELLDEVIPVIEKFNPLFIGVNCVSIPIATKIIHYLRTITSFPLSVYAQGDGEPENDQGWKFRHQETEKIYLKAAKQWLKDGAQIIGGCCGTTPGYIKKLKKVIKNNE
ncbi:MAG TPA: homocysteine S-methyltransferase family protein [Candidatus Sulfotelmatobacter sp.]|jgi:homocysteine S-methyltransferase|nr:homocysteine S-methyltransferase family protein [Candidatus Sulfotelmatobacter sp.]